MLTGMTTIVLPWLSVAAIGWGAYHAARFPHDAHVGWIVFGCGLLGHLWTTFSQERRLDDLQERLRVLESAAK